MGPDTPPSPAVTDRLIVLETEGWERTDAQSHAALDILLARLSDAGVTLLRRGDHVWIEALESAIADATIIASMITAWENRWNYRNLINRHPNGVSERIKGRLDRVEAMTPNDYRDLLLRRQNARTAHRALAPLADAIITFSSPGPAPVWLGDVPNEPLAPYPTGDAVFNYASSILGAPVVTIPTMAVGGLPLGLQVMGQREEDARVTGIARWIQGAVEPVVV